MKRIQNDSTRRDEKRTSHGGRGTGGRLRRRLIDTPSQLYRQDRPSPHPEFRDTERNSRSARADKYTCSDAQSDRQRLAAPWRRANGEAFLLLSCNSYFCITGRLRHARTHPSFSSRGSLAKARARTHIRGPDA